MLQTRVQGHMPFDSGGFENRNCLPYLPYDLHVDTLTHECSTCNLCLIGKAVLEMFENHGNVARVI